MHLSDFDYVLPPELIAQHPAAERAASRLLHLDGRTGEMRDRMFRDLVDLVDAKDLLVFNDTKVIKARLRGRKETGGEVEILVERILDPSRALAHVRASKTPKPGRQIRLARGGVVEVLGREGELFELLFLDGPVLDVLEAWGEVPLPPYIGHAPEADDERRYQTVYARAPGAVAAPTAGLHFDAAMLDALRAKGASLATLTLHVGAGTFQPVRVDDVSQHVMHSEWYSVPQETVDAIAAAKARGGRVLAVGTTTLRALESAASAGELAAGTAETRLFIVPGYRFRVVERLLTNFHLPRSTLLMLVSAFAGVDNIRRAYAHAVDERYRFFSYGDAMLIERA
ncbi:MAG TPA: tRNA preQ1(34) S-adenosylmethionine ribosyltransferase-isomerase QueA [Usitatibacter sp.]